MNSSEPVVYLNGAMIPASQARLPIDDAGIVMGATVTEQTRTFRGRPFRLDEHLDRLAGSLRYARLDPGLSTEELRNIALELVEHNFAGRDLGIIHFVTAGEFAPFAPAKPVRRGPTVCVHTFPLPFERWVKGMREGARLVTPPIRHVPPQCYDPRMKCRSRMHFYLADLEAKDVDPEATALLLDLEGNVTETAAANFLMVKAGTLISPTTRNTLPGISRGMVMELAKQLEIALGERDFPISEAVTAEEALLTSTPFCVMPVARINGTMIGNGAPGPVFRQLIDAWGQMVGVDIVEQILS